MSTTSPATVSAAASLDTKLEVVIIPVADVERSKRFYTGLGWRLDADFAAGDVWRVVQVTPPGSPCSVIFGKGVTTAAPGSAQGLFLVVDDVEAARAALASRGAPISEVFHFEGSMLHATGSQGRVPGRDPGGSSYRSWASFADPDGNGWLLQEIRTRLPGRGTNVDVATMTALLRDAEDHHGHYEPTAPKHHWSDWYAGYIVGRMRGLDADAAVREATAHVEAGLR